LAILHFKEAGKLEGFDILVSYYLYPFHSPFGLSLCQVLEEKAKSNKTMKLKLQTTKTVKPLPPFDFDSTFHKPDHFTSGDNFWQPGVRWQTFYFDSPNPPSGGEVTKKQTFFQGERVGVKFENKGTTNNPNMLISIYSDKNLPKDFVDSLIEEIKYRYNLDLDLSGFYQALRSDKVLGPIVKRWRGLRPGHQNSLYEYLVIGIVLQNATVRRSIQMLQALLQNYGQELEFDGQKLWCFWEPGGLKNVSEEELRALKVGYRAKSIKKIDGFFAEGKIEEMDLRKKPREEQMEELLKLYGVGPATVWYLLFDVFHHWDFFSHISPWEQKIYSKLFFNRDPENPVPVKKLLKHFERFGKYKQLAVHYLWEDLWWKRKNESVPWLERLIKV